LGRGARRPRRTDAIEFVLRVELRQNLVGFDPIANLALPLEDAAANAKGESHFVFSADIARESDGIADFALFDRHRPDGTRLRRLGFGFLIAPREHEGERRRDHEVAYRAREKGAWGQDTVLELKKIALVLIAPPPTTQREARDLAVGGAALSASPLSPRTRWPR
jgi:hypothetical protein